MQAQDEPASRVLANSEHRMSPRSFVPNQIDATFDPLMVFTQAPPPGVFNLSPHAGLQGRRLG